MEMTSDVGTGKSARIRTEMDMIQGFGIGTGMKMETRIGTE